MTPATEILAPAPWTAQLIPCAVYGNRVGCIAGVVGYLVPLRVRGPGALETVKRLRAWGYVLAQPDSTDYSEVT